jgi:hypothetical protein
VELLRRWRCCAAKYSGRAKVRVMFEREVIERLANGDPASRLSLRHNPPSSETASCLLGRRRYWGDSVSELFGFGLEALDL